VLLSELLATCRREMAGVRDAAPGEAEILVSAVTGIPRSRLFLSMQDETGDASVRLLPLTARRAAGEPLQYILGAWDFFGREFLLSPDTLIRVPRRRGWRNGRWRPFAVPRVPDPSRSTSGRGAGRSR